ncbi:MAG: nodulation protein NfeD [Spirochaetes bacterium]|nr:nodulation protein NfeD [Spirochaetota bacterium]
MKKKRIIIQSLVLASAIAMAGGAARPQAPGGIYAVMKLDGMVSPIMAEYLEDSIDRAQKEGARFIVIQMDTPGGLMSSMRQIIQSILQSKVPVVVYTYPRGAQAASAGGFIMLSAHVAAMAPGTEIGAMHPVSPMLNFMKKDDRGGPAGIMEKKVLNDTVAYARSLAQKRGRNQAWAERAVRDAISSTYLEARRQGVIDLVAEDMDDLLKQLEGRRIEVGGPAGTVRMETDGLRPVEYGMEWHQRVANSFADPQIMLVLLILAVVGIGIEMKNPGLIFPGVIGAISLLLFLLTVRILPVNMAGIAFIVLAVILFIMELKFTSYGLLTVAGIASFVFGAMILFQSPLPGGYIPLTTIIATLLVIMAVVFIVLRAVMQAHRGRVSTGIEGLRGESGEAMRAFTGRGKVFIHGEIWDAESDSEIKEKETVVVTDVRGMTLLVKRK